MNFKKIYILSQTILNIILILSISERLELFKTVFSQIHSNFDLLWTFLSIPVFFFNLIVLMLFSCKKLECQIYYSFLFFLDTLIITFLAFLSLLFWNGVVDGGLIKMFLN